MEIDTRDNPRADRREFVNAVAEHLWVRPGTDRPLVKPPLLLMFTALAAVAALATGVILHMLHKNDPPPPDAAPTPVVTQAPPVWTAVAGWDCTGDPARGFDAVGRTRACYVVSTGGWEQDGCNGSFIAVPMSGSAKDDQGQYATWVFKPGDGYGTCEISAYAPKVVRLQDAAATSAHYLLSTGTGGAPMADVTVDQPANAGRWVPVGSYPVSQGGLTIRLANHGRPPIADGRIAVAQFRASCRQ